MTDPKRTTRSKYLFCVSNRGYPVSLIVRCIYRRLGDAAAARADLVRVIDETGEDYLFPSRLFVEVDLPREAARAFRAAG